jgi:hypothetical protein
MIVLITPTGGRPKQFDLCNRWMSQQTYEGKVFWVIVDDCVPITTELKIKMPDNWIVVYKYPVLKWKVSDNTQSRNLQVGIDLVKKIPANQVEGIFIIEDDDYYSPVYLEQMVAQLDGFDVAAERHTIYYHVGIKAYHGGDNKRHASLFQVAFKPTAIPVFENSLGAKFIDIVFFNKLKRQDNLKVNRFDRKNLAIGIKGITGRKGIGMGHNERTYKTIDKDLEHLKTFIKNDYIYYL